MTERTDMVCEEHPFRRWPHGLDPVFPERDCPGPGMLPQNQEQLDALLRAVNGDADGPWCCYISDVHRICTTDPIFEIKGDHFEDQIMTCVAHLSEMAGPNDTVHLLGHEMSVHEEIAASA